MMDAHKEKQNDQASFILATQAPLDPNDVCLSREDPAPSPSHAW